MDIQRKFTGMLLLGFYTDIMLCISIDFFSLLFMSFSNSVFALFESVQGMCNIKRTFAMVRLGGSGSVMAEKSVTYLYHLTCSVSCVAEEIPESKKLDQLFNCDQTNCNFTEDELPHAPNKLP